MALNEAGPGAVKPGGRHGRVIGRILALAPIRYWLRDPVERAAFQLTAAGLVRARDVKLRVYPQLAQLAVFPLIFLVGTSSRRHGDPGGFSALPIAFVGAMLSTMIFNSIEMLRFSDHWRGAELFRLVPLESPARLFHGARKAMLLLLCWSPGRRHDLSSCWSGKGFRAAPCCCCRDSSPCLSSRCSPASGIRSCHFPNRPNRSGTSRTACCGHWWSSFPPESSPASLRSPSWRGWLLGSSPRGGPGGRPDLDPAALHRRSAVAGRGRVMPSKH